MYEKASETGIVYYSLSGHSQRLARRLGTELKATLLDLIAPKYRRGPIGYLRAGYDSLRQRDTPLKPPLPTLADFRQIILCGPVWTSYPAVPLRTLVRADLPLPRVVASFLTSGSQSPASKAFAVLEADLGGPLAATALLPNSAEGTGQEEQIIANFLTDLQRSASRIGAD